MSRILAIILAALLVVGGSIYLLSMHSGMSDPAVNVNESTTSSETSQSESDSAGAEESSQSSQASESNESGEAENPSDSAESKESSESSSSSEQQEEDVDFEALWREFIVDTWEWQDEGKDLIFEFKENQDFTYYEKAHADDPSASEDTASGVWEIVEAGTYVSRVKLISYNEQQTEIIFNLEFIDPDNMAAHTDDMPDDTYVLFTRLED